MSEPDEYTRKLDSLQQYIPFLNCMIEQLKDPKRKKNREEQLSKMVSLHTMITNRKKRLKLETLIKCEEVILKLYNKVNSGTNPLQTPEFAAPPPPQPVPPPQAVAAPALKVPEIDPITPSSPSPPPPDTETIEFKQPVVIIPTEKVVNESDGVEDSSKEVFKPICVSPTKKIDIYSNVVISKDSGKSDNVEMKKMAESVPEMLSKPPISFEDLKILQECDGDDDKAGVEKLSLMDLNKLREQIQEELSIDGKVKPKKDEKKVVVDTTVRSSKILTKKAVEKNREQEKLGIKKKEERRERDSVSGRRHERERSRERDRKKEEHRKRDEQKKKDERKRDEKKKEEVKKDERRKEEAAKKEEAIKPAKEEENPAGVVKFRRLADKYNPKPRRPSISCPIAAAPTPPTPSLPPPPIPPTLPASSALTASSFVVQQQQQQPSPSLSSHSSDSMDFQNKLTAPNIVGVSGAVLPAFVPIQQQLQQQQHRPLMPIPSLMNVNMNNQFAQRPQAAPFAAPIQPQFAPINPNGNNRMDYYPNQRFLKPIVPAARIQLPPQPVPPPARILQPVPLLPMSETKYLHQQQQQRPPLQQQQQQQNCDFMNSGKDVDWRRMPPNVAPVPTPPVVGAANASWQPMQRNMSRSKSVGPSGGEQRSASAANTRDPRLNRCSTPSLLRDRSSSTSSNDNNARKMEAGGKKSVNSPLDRLYETDKRKSETMNRKAALNKVTKQQHSNKLEDKSRKTKDKAPVLNPLQKYKIPKKPKQEDVKATSPPTTTKDDNDVTSSTNDEDNGIGSLSGAKQQEEEISSTSSKEQKEKEKEQQQQQLTPEISSDKLVEIVGSENVEQKEIGIINEFLEKLLKNSNCQSVVAKHLLSTIITSSNATATKDDEELKAKEEEERLKREKFNEIHARKLKLRKMKVLAYKKRMKHLLASNNKKKSLKKKEATTSEEEEEDSEEEESEEEIPIRRKKQQQTKKLVGRPGKALKKQDKVPTKPEVKKKSGKKLKKVKKGKKKNELDRLHESIQEMFIRDDVLQAIGPRTCSKKSTSVPSSPSTSSTNLASPRKRRRNQDLNLIEEQQQQQHSKLNQKICDVRVVIDKLPIDSLTAANQRYSLRAKRNSEKKSYKDLEHSDEEEEKAATTTTSATSSNVATKKQLEVTAASDVTPTLKTIVKKETIETVFPDKEYYPRLELKLKIDCLLCDFNGKLITTHYKNTHPNSEIFSSRLSPKQAELAIKESIALNLNNLPEDLKKMRMKKSEKYQFRCRFCTFEQNQICLLYYDHLTTHTGEYRFACKHCLDRRDEVMSDNKKKVTMKNAETNDMHVFSSCNWKTIKHHFHKVHYEELLLKQQKMAKGKKSNSIDPDLTKYQAELMIKVDFYSQLFGYLCTECNYVQMNRDAVESHVKIYHLNDDVKVMRINLSELPPDYLFKPKNVEVEKVKELNENDAIEEKNEDVEKEAIEDGVVDDEKSEEIEDANTVPEDMEIETPIITRIIEENQSDEKKETKIENLSAFICRPSDEESAIDTKSNEMVDTLLTSELDASTTTATTKRRRETLNFIDKFLLQQTNDDNNVNEDDEDVEKMRETNDFDNLICKKPSLEKQEMLIGGKMTTSKQQGDEKEEKKNQLVSGIVDKLKGILSKVPNEANEESQNNDEDDEEEDEQEKVKEKPDKVANEVIVLEKEEEKCKIDSKEATTKNEEEEEEEIPKLSEFKKPTQPCFSFKLFNIVLSNCKANEVKFEDNNDLKIEYACQLPSCGHIANSPQLFIQHLLHSPLHSTCWNDKKQQKEINCFQCKEEINWQSEIEGDTVLVKYFNHVLAKHCDFMKKKKKEEQKVETKKMEETIEKPAAEDDEGPLMLLKSEEEFNPFPFKIVDVKSLANESTSPRKQQVVEKVQQQPQHVDETKKNCLSPLELYRCFKCQLILPNPMKFKHHIIQPCLTSEGETTKSPLKPFKCAHCFRTFKNTHGLLEHIQFHGYLRFHCCLCEKKFPSTLSIKLHVRNKHNALQVFYLKPLIASKNNQDVDEFVWRPCPQKEPNESTTTTTISIGNSMTISSCSSTSTSLTKSSDDSSSDNSLSLIYQPNEIEKLPHRSIFDLPIKCAQCSFETKVRSNLVRHFQFHLRNENIPETCPVNPVPCLERNGEKMFDKMTNLALSSIIVQQNVKPSSAGAATTTVTVEKSEETSESLLVPQYVPLTKRYACPSDNCTYLCLEEANLRQHLVALHAQEKNFRCCHCSNKKDTYRSYDDYLKHLKWHDLDLYKCGKCNEFVHHLWSKIEKHLSDKHEIYHSGFEHVVTVRQMKYDLFDNNQCQVTKQREMPPNQQMNTTTTVCSGNFNRKEWNCGICKHKSSKQVEMINHLRNKHSLSETNEIKRLKCELCDFMSDEKDDFKQHYKVFHWSEVMGGGNSEFIEMYFYKKDDVPTSPMALSGSAKRAMIETKVDLDTTPIWQRNKPRIKHIRGILIDESGEDGGMERRKMKKSNSGRNIYCGSSTSTILTPLPASPAAGNSNLDLAIEAVASGISVNDKKPVNLDETVTKITKVTALEENELINVEDEDEENDNSLIFDEILDADFLTKQSKDFLVDIDEIINFDDFITIERINEDDEDEGKKMSFDKINDDVTIAICSRTNDEENNVGEQQEVPPVKKRMMARKSTGAKQQKSSFLGN